MSHSQWEKKKYKKAASEGKTSKLFNKLVRFITLEAKKSAGNRESPGLKAAIQKARAADMPSDNIDRAIKKASEPGADMETITYEAYGPGGVALIIVCLTDSRNRAAQEIKHILSENGTSLGAIGSVTWAFAHEKTDQGFVWKPTTMLPLSDADLASLEKLVDELEENDEVQDIFTNAE